MKDAVLPEALSGVFEPDAAGGPVLIGSHCRECGADHFPPKPACPDCACSTVEPTELPRDGTLHSWTIVRIPAPGIEPPFLLGEIHLPNGLRVTSRLEPGDYELGQTVRLAAGIVRQDDGMGQLTGYFFGVGD